MPGINGLMFESNQYIKKKTKVKIKYRLHYLYFILGFALALLLNYLWHFIDSN